MSKLKHDFVNTEMVDKLIGRIKNRSNEFHMGRWDACICGQMKRIEGIAAHSLMNHTEWGAERLNISREKAEKLFFSGSRCDAYPTRAQVVRCLKTLRDEGVVDWERACA